jgi:hypothetical protein
MFNLSVLCLCPVLFLFGVCLGSLPLVLVAGSHGGCVHWTPPFLVDLVYHILQLFHRNDHIETMCRAQHCGRYLEGQGYSMTLEQNRVRPITMLFETGPKTCPDNSADTTSVSSSSTWSNTRVFRLNDFGGVMALEKNVVFCVLSSTQILVWHCWCNIIQTLGMISTKSSCTYHRLVWTTFQKLLVHVHQSFS